MRAYEQKKGLDIGGKMIAHGRVWMMVEGDEAEVVAVCAILDKQFKNDSCPQDDGPGAYSEGYYVDRSEKADFMAAYKAAKASVKGK